MATPVEEMQTLSTDLLLAIVKGDVSAVQLAKMVLIGRGLGPSGQWIGFGPARSFWTGMYYATDANGQRVVVTIPTKDEEETDRDPQ
jgi:hypothetical protein